MFQLSEDQLEKLSKWIEEQDLKVAKKQERENPYYGATGGSYTYKFTPTSLGLVTVVENNLTKESINLTDYDSW